MWTPIVGKPMTLPALQIFIDEIRFDHWRPVGMVLHNTGAPTLKQWHQVPGEVRMRNLEHYFKTLRGWPSAPHAFVADDYVWPFTPFNRPGTHSPSWNGTRLGIEMVGDFETEPFDSGAGALVRKHTVALFGMLHKKLGIDPQTIKFHREDPKTTHKCPGKNVPKVAFIQEVEEWMGSAGDLTEAPIVAKPAPVERPGVVVVPKGDVLNLRETSSASSAILAKLEAGTEVGILDEATNGATQWARVIIAGGKTGWVAARYIKGA